MIIEANEVISKVAWMATLSVAGDICPKGPVP